MNKHLIQVFWFIVAFMIYRKLKTQTVEQTSNVNVSNPETVPLGNGGVTYTQNADGSYSTNF